MSRRITTSRLALRAWDLADATGHQALVAEQDDGVPPEIAFELHEQVHNRGDATEAAGAVVSAAAETGRRRLWATVGAWNAPSLRVCDKLGFERDRISEVG